MADIPLARPFIDQEMMAAAARVLESGRWVKGPEADLFAEEFAAHCGALAGASCMNGSAALIATLRLLGIGPGDEVIVPTLTFLASATCIDLVGARPVFVDVETDYWCLDPDGLDAARTSATKAVIAVHLFGQPCSPRVFEWAQTHGIPVIEDAAQAHGAVLGDQMAGSIGSLATFSFFPSKNMAVGGEGGMITTTDPDLAIELQRIVDHGRIDSSTSTSLSTNMRLSEVQSAIGRIQLRHLDEWTRIRRENAERLTSALQNLEGIHTPKVRQGCSHSWHQYCLLVADPRGLIDHLSRQGISSAIHYPIPCHRQPIYADHPQHAPGTFPSAETLGPGLVAIPVHPHLSPNEMDHIIESVRAWSDR